MSDRLIKSILSIRRLATLLVLIAYLVSPAPTNGQANPSASPTPPDQKAQAIIDRAIEALGGSNYLSARTVVSSGLFTNFHEGVSQVPAKFLDYIVYPDKERTEFISSGIRTVQTNTGA
ncbi:MAG: hypothetical protein ACREBC_32660, partial [Pyrinomonadaceae bacterium]